MSDQDQAVAEDAPPVDLDVIGAELAAVEAALARLDEGTYGSCTACGAPMPDEDLAADPTATVCPAHLDLPGTDSTS